MTLPIDTSLVPPDVRVAGPGAVKLYGAALQFEGLLVQQITQQMFDGTQAASGEDADGSDGPGAAGGPYQAMLPGTLADAITAGGGLGLAPELYRTISQRLGMTSATGGEAA
jgi:Rod binding domain-containing protein